MKALYIILCFCVIGQAAFAQEFVSTDPQLRNVVLEEFTGIHCGNCPGGHKKARALSEAYPGRVVLISIHEGYYAVPRTGEPDFRTQYGPAVLSQANVTAFPCATVNRKVFPGEGEYPYWVQRQSGMAMSVNGWTPAAEDSLLNGTYSPLNIAAIPRWDNDTRTLSVDVEVYFTEAVPNEVKLNIALLESHVWGPQTGASDPNHYEHNHIFRDYLTGQWGETMSETAKGSLFQKTFTYQVDEDFEITNCDLALFATDGQNRNIYTGIDMQVVPPKAALAVKDGKTHYTVSGAAKDITLELQNLSEQDVTFQVGFTPGAITPVEWTATVENSSDVTIAAGATVEKTFRVVPGGKHGVGDYHFTVSEPGNPVSNAVHDSIRVVTTDIAQLEIDAGGSILDDVQQSRSAFISLPYSVFTDIEPHLNVLTTIVWNTGKTGGIDSTQAVMIESMIQDGINILFSGSGGVPLLALNYPGNSLLPMLGIGWGQLNELPFTTFSLQGVASDPVTNGFSASGLSVTNNGYMMQKMDITDASKAFPMLRMVETGDAVSVRTQNANARSIYLGFNPAIIEDGALRINLITKSLDWLEGVTSIGRPAELAQTVDIKASIHAQSNHIVVHVDAAEHFSNAIISVYDVRGIRVQTLFEGSMDAAGATITAPFSHPRGVYYVRFVSGSRHMVVPVAN